MEGLQGVFNGDFLPLEDIKISPMSRAYTFADAIYEVVPFIQGRPVALDLHLKRLLKSCKAIDLDIDILRVQREIEKLAQDALTNNTGYVYYQITRGQDRVRNHLYALDLIPETFGYATITKQTTRIQKAKIVQDIRWGRCDIKSTALLGNIMLMNQANFEGANEIIMHRDGLVTEAGSSNVFMIMNRKVITPPKESNILAGITRELLLKHFSQDFELLEETCHIDALAEADVVFLTSSTKGIMAIDQIQDNKYCFNQANSTFVELKTAFNNFLNTAF